MFSFTVMEWLSTADGFTAIFAGLVFVGWCVSALISGVREIRSEAKSRISPERQQKRQESSHRMLQAGTPAWTYRA